MFMRSFSLTPQTVWSLIIASLIGVGLFAVGVLRNHTLDFWYLSSNLALGVIPFLLAVWLRRLLKKAAWRSWKPIALTVLWVVFLPNSFYIISDFIHLNDAPRVDMVQDVVMLMQFSFVGVTLGFMSLFMVRGELAKRLRNKTVHGMMIGLLLLCSFAMYVGRELRWNSWDVAVQPLALVSDILQRLSDPAASWQALITTGSFFVLLASVYVVLQSLHFVTIKTLDDRAR